MAQSVVADCAVAASHVTLSSRLQKARSGGEHNFQRSTPVVSSHQLGSMLRRLSNALQPELSAAY